MHTETVPGPQLARALRLHPLPEKPAALPALTIDYDFTASGNPRTRITAPGRGGTVTFRDGPMADPITDAWSLDAQFFADLTKKDMDAFLAWGFATHRHIMASISDYLQELSSASSIRAELIHRATR